jgi:hypothetical protein
LSVRRVITEHGSNGSAVVSELCVATA